MAAVKSERYARHVDAIFVVLLFLGRLGEVNFVAGDDVGVIFVEAFDRGGAGLMFEANDQRIFNPARGMKVSVKARHPFDGLIGIVGELIQAKIVGRDERVAEQMFFDVLIPRFPIRAAGFIHADERH